MRTPPLAIRQPRAARLSPLAAALALAFAPVALASPLEVTHTGDSGPNSLRDAISFANSDCGSTSAPVITFNIPGTGPFTISPSSPLPLFQCLTNAYSPTVDGGGTPGAPRIVLDGTSSGASCGLRHNYNFTYGGDLTVLGMKFQNFSYGSFDAGVCGGAITVKRNLFTNNSIGAYILSGGTSLVGGTAADRNVFTGNSNAGVRVNGTAAISHNLVGTANGTTASPNGIGIYLNFAGTSSVSENVISGNTGAGLYVYGDYGGSVISDNNIGTNAAGTAALPNGGDGVYVRYSNDLRIRDNTISGNSFAGINFYDSSSIQVDNNLIGTNATQSAAVPNLGGGISVSRGSVEINGGTISGNSGAGVTFSSLNDFFKQSEINGAFIGQNSSGTPLPNTRGVDAFCSGYIDINGSTISNNQFEGIYFDRVDSATLTGNTIKANGGTGVRLGANPLLDCFQSGNGNNLFDNTIRNNGQNGVLMTGGTGNSIYAGSITGNSVKNININNSGSAPLPNDAGDGDGGPNNQQNYPVIASVVQSGGNTLVTFALDSLDGTYDIQFYANSAFGSAGGQTYLGSTTVTVSGGPVTLTDHSLSGLYNNISATATRLAFPLPVMSRGVSAVAAGAIPLDTSEFSPMKAILAAPAAATVVVRPDVLDFGSVPVGSTSAARTSTLTSLGDQAYDIDVISSNGCYGGPICYGGSFICQTTCDTAASYGRNQSCRISASFAPQFKGPASTTIYICDNASASPRSILLQGNGVGPPPIVVSPPVWDFGNVPVGVVSRPAGFTVRNQSSSSITLGAITTTGEFDLRDSTCGSSLAYGASCAANVSFQPTQSGAARGELVVPYVECCTPAAAAQAGKAATAESVKATLRGNGVSGGELTLPGPIEVGAASVGRGPISTTVALVNTGTAPVIISAVTVSSPFTLVNNCTAPLAPGATCTLVIGFTAPGLGSFTGSLTVVSDASGGSGVVPVHATGQAIAAPLIVVSPFSIGFGDRIIGSSTAPQAITLTNIGGVTATLSLATTSVDFLLTGNNCGATLEPRASCVAQVTFRPLGFGLRVSSFVVTSNSAESPQSVSLSGTGCRPYVASGNRSGEPSNCAP